MNLKCVQVFKQKQKGKYIGSFWDRVDSPLGLDWSSDYIETLE